MREGERKRDRDREKNLFERIWDVPRNKTKQNNKGEKPDFWKEGNKGSLRIERPTLIAVLSTSAVDQHQELSVSVCLPSSFKFLGIESRNSRGGWIPSVQAEPWLWGMGWSIRKIQETDSRRRNNGSWTNRNNRCPLHHFNSIFRWGNWVPEVKCSPQPHS